MSDQEESDQLPEEGPGSQTHDDDSDAGARDEAEDSPGVPGDNEQSTGNPEAAGSEDPEEGES